MSSELTLSLRIGAITADPVPRSVMEALTDVSVRAGGSDGSPSGFELKFATSKVSEITRQLLPSGYFDPPRRVIIGATLRGVTTVLMDGVITHQDVVPSDEAGKSVLSIKGEDLTRMMDLIDFSGFPFPATAAELRVMIMVAKYLPIYNIVPMVMPSVLIDEPDPASHIPVQRGTDLTYIKLLAARAGYTFYMAPGPLMGTSMAYWGPKLRASIPFLPQPTPFAIDMDGRSNVESLQFSFDGFKKTLFVVLIKIPSVPIPIPIPIPDVTPLSPPLGKKSPMPLKISPLTGLAKYTQLQAAGIGLAKTADAANVISGGGSLDVLRYGEILNPRTIVQVRGAGITYDGDYFVDSVTHTIKPGSYKQSFTLMRNALIAGSGIPGLNELSYGLSSAQQLAGFADAAVTSRPSPPGAPALPIPAPPLPGPGAGLPALPGGGPPMPGAPGVGSVARSLPTSPSP